MSKYFMITTQACGRCKRVMDVLTKVDKVNEVLAVDYRSALGKELSRKFDIRTAGSIHSMESGEEVAISVILAK